MAVKEVVLWTGAGQIVIDPQGASITCSDFLIDGGATASYYYGPLQPETRE